VSAARLTPHAITLRCAHRLPSTRSNFLRHLFPAFYALLSEGQPQFAEARPIRLEALVDDCNLRAHHPCSLGVQGPEQKIRNMLLEVLNRLPNNETLRPHVQVMGLAVNPLL